MVRSARIAIDRGNKNEGARLLRQAVEEFPDEIVPLRMGQALFDAARCEKQIYIIEGAGHNDSYHTGGKAYLAQLQQFLARLTPPSAAAVGSTGDES